jgi:NAD+ kinase
VQQRYPGADVWHVVAGEFVRGGAGGQSIIHQKWADGQKLWAQAGFIVVTPPEEKLQPKDLPPRHVTIASGTHLPTAYLRTRVYHGQSIDKEVLPEVAAYIRRQGLYAAAACETRETPLGIPTPRWFLYYDERNPKACETAKRYQQYASPLETANLILVIGGDGTMLTAIREHWRQRLPFIGINAGNLGFLMNETLDTAWNPAEFLAYRLPMLHVEVTNLQNEYHRCLAFSDCWLERDSGQAAWLRILVDGKTRIQKLVCDGALLATAAGSPAYARAMGATPLPFSSPILTLAGSNVFRPHFWKPIALPDTAEICLENLDSTGKRPVRCFVDGLSIGPARRICARVSDVASVELVFTREFDPSARLLRSLFPPDQV